MTPAAAVVLLVTAVALFAAPRRWAPVPLLVAACYTTRAPIVDIGPVTFTLLRVLVVVGLVRVVLRRERWETKLGTIDALVVIMGIWTVLSVAFHRDPSVQVVVRLRTLFDAWGMYFLFRIFCRTWDDVANLARVASIVIVPLAVLMLIEKLAAFNPFGLLGALEAVGVREDTIRARGPFQHSILAGTVGAVFLPLCIAVWPRRKGVAATGVVACVIIAFASASSGPVLAMMAGIGALCLWPLRDRMYMARWAAVLTYVLLEIVMNRPAYYLTTSAAIFSGSSGWFRARLIDSAIRHWSEWWLAGTDYTRHWMGTGVAFSADSADITNHFIGLGVTGGLALLAMFIAILVSAFRAIGRARLSAASGPQEFLIWAVGAALFAHVATCFSVSYYDQTIFFFYMTLGTVCATPARAPVAARVAPAQQSSGARWNPAFNPRRSSFAGNAALRRGVTLQRRTELR